MSEPQERKDTPAVEPAEPPRRNLAASVGNPYGFVSITSLCGLDKHGNRRRVRRRRAAHRE